MSYQKFAYLYDELMADAPYSKWLSFIHNAVFAFRPNTKRLLDIGCGTGSMPILLAKEGYEVTGVDLSSDMLMVAKEKAENENIPLSLFQQDMRELEGLGTFDCVTILCDSLNYILTEEDVKQTFLSAWNHLEPEGLFIFDVHSIHKINEVFIESTFGSNDEEISYIWHCYQGEFENSVEHDLSFFIRNHHHYERYDELHIQRTFSTDDYSRWLNECRFEVLSITADFEDQKPSEQSERILFIAQKS
ncbi:class I SAM-dependent DNA methyltransferase [Fictibacillus phosphorivorans]|uniref:class I SAM-dependent DNA methyltransferase n=1 Tax=Fictibacillus phosphorivorans TaxID=1221500 RepID=UPI00203F8C03|nr:class I SAM-dependent methyltransferase [Fictibacillus phosphorivorans]MCM3716899.1 class I SAM-dependent methyltransferase [Fictibacillus phosphorivorans]MCM3774552.1 class I SAM-dependent methyltransferase [Fictibacillus phosphorivorans]